MKTLLIAILSLITTITFAQQSVTSKGGTLGNETSWNVARNWSNNKVPNEFSDVIINDVSTSTFSAPVIKEGTIELNSIRIASNGQLTVESTAKVIVYGYTEGIIKENINLEGTLMVMEEFVNTDLENMVILGDN
jgi:Tol biopolymer transport system component